MTGLGVKVALALMLAAGIVGAGLAYREHVYNLGHKAARDERAALDGVAVLQRTRNNVILAERQSAINAFLTKENNEQMFPVRNRIVTERVYVGAGICGGSAASTDTESAAGGPDANPGRRLVRSDIERDFRALKLTVEDAFAAGRACQGFVKQNGMGE